MNFPERVATQAEQVRLVRILLTVLAVPFYLVGLAAGLVWLALKWVAAAVMVGWSDVKKSREVTDAG